MDDLLVGAPGVNGLLNGFKPQAGRIYLVPGSATPPTLPALSDIITLANWAVPGSGQYLITNQNGQPERFNSVTTPDINGDGTPDFVLLPGADRWFQFTTLGVGQPGDAIRLSPGATSSLVKLSPAASGVATPVGASTGNDLAVGNGTTGVLEFDLGLFLQQLGTPDAIAVEDEAESLKKKLEEQGATVEIK